MKGSALSRISYRKNVISSALSLSCVSFGFVSCSRTLCIDRATIAINGLFSALHRSCALGCGLWDGTWLSRWRRSCRICLLFLGRSDLSKEMFFHPAVCGSWTDFGSLFKGLKWATF